MESDFKIGIIGLGIIGGSLAYALKGFKNAYIIGCDTDAKTREAAITNKAVDLVSENPKDAIRNSDLVIICTFPKTIVEIIKENKGAFKSGAVLTEVCGVKTALTEEILRNLPENVEYAGSHPMAGKEVGGFENASPDLFKGTGFIVTTTEETKEDGISLIYQMAEYIGAVRITKTTPKEHDRIIAYTSDLMHIAASGLCLEFPEEMNMAYTAGAYRDCTRVADINPVLWTELFMANAKNTIKEIERFTNSLNRFKTAIENGDEKGLTKILEQVRDNKREMLTREP